MRTSEKFYLEEYTKHANNPDFIAGFEAEANKDGYTTKTGEEIFLDQLNGFLASEGFNKVASLKEAEDLAEEYMTQTPEQFKQAALAEGYDEDFVLGFQKQSKDTIDAALSEKNAHWTDMLQRMGDRLFRTRPLPVRNTPVPKIPWAPYSNAGAIPRPPAMTGGIPRPPGGVNYPPPPYRDIPFTAGFEKNAANFGALFRGLMGKARGMFGGGGAAMRPTAPVPPPGAGAGFGLGSQRGGLLSELAPSASAAAPVAQATQTAAPRAGQGFYFGNGRPDPFRQTPVPNFQASAPSPVKPPTGGPGPLPQTPASGVQPPKQPLMPPPTNAPAPGGAAGPGTPPPLPAAPSTMPGATTGGTTGTGSHSFNGGGTGPMTGGTKGTGTSPTPGAPTAPAGRPSMGEAFRTGGRTGALWGSGIGGTVGSMFGPLGTLAGSGIGAGVGTGIGTAVSRFGARNALLGMGAAGLGTAGLGAYGGYKALQSGNQSDETGLPANRNDHFGIGNKWVGGIGGAIAAYMLAQQTGMHPMAAMAAAGLGGIGGYKYFPQMMNKMNDNPGTGANMEDYQRYLMNRQFPPNVMGN